MLIGKFDAVASVEISSSVGPFKTLTQTPALALALALALAPALALALALVLALALALAFGLTNSTENSCWPNEEGN